MDIAIYPKDYYTDKITNSRWQQKFKESILRQNSSSIKRSSSYILQEIFNKLNEEFEFTYALSISGDDITSSQDKALIAEEYKRNWQGSIVFCDLAGLEAPGNWIEKCYEESKKKSSLIVALIPTACCSQYCRGIIYNKARQVRFVRSGVRNNSVVGSDSFECMVVIF